MSHLTCRAVVMWVVEFESPRLEKEVEKLIKSKKLTKEDRIIISTWIRLIAEEGPEFIASQKRWDDHEFYDEWKGYRSSCFSNSGRVIYKIDGQVIKILIAWITADRNYRRLK